MIHTTLLQASDGSSFTSFLPIIGMIAIFYFFFIRPQQRKQKDTKKFLLEVKKGDMVVTTGGIHGKLLDVTDTTAQIEVDKGTKMTIDRVSISMEATARQNQPNKK